MQATRGETALNQRRGSRTVLLLTAAVAVALDQATKTIAVRALEPGETVPVVTGVLHWTLQHNPGAAFSLFRSVPVLFTVLASIVVVAIVVTSGRPRALPSSVALGLVLGGAAGNLGDRLFRAPGAFQGYVVDFIDFRVWPTFNIADVAVVSGAILLAVASVRDEKRAREQA